MTPEQKIEFEKQKRRQKKWRITANPEVNKDAWALLNNEYTEPGERRAAHEAGLKQYFGFITQAIPYYQHRLGEGFKGQQDMLEYIHACPILTKSDLREHANDLVAKVLPRGHQVAGQSSSSGTTGKPVKVLTTQVHGLSFRLLKQRECRWFGMDPHATLGVLRIPSQFHRVNGKTITPGQTIRGSWPTVGELFKTGPFYGFSVLNSIEDQKEWLKKINPSYLMSYAESLEHLAFYYGERTHLGALKGLHSISETLTPDMRERIRGVFPVPIYQNYGLNELGLVAAKCPEGGRYHVHDEFFHVEIINEKGERCKPGETGKIIVTGKMNLAMPLLRYDTDDLAMATDQNCPCGRTSPCFGEVLGRYSRIAYLPEGTLGMVAILRDALSNCPDDIANDILKFQIHQESELTFHLRLKLREGRLNNLVHYFNGVWEESIDNENATLRVSRVDDLKAGHNGKYHDFTSVFHP